MKFENLELELNRMLSDLGLPESSLKQRNASYRGGSHREYYMSACRAAVEAHFADELRLFNYNF